MTKHTNKLKELRARVEGFVDGLEWSAQAGAKIDWKREFRELVDLIMEEGR